jgi:hypothetical protein
MRFRRSRGNRDDRTSGTKRLDLWVVPGGSRTECDVRPDHAYERASANRCELPLLLLGLDAGSEPIAVRFHDAPTDHDDGVRTEFGDWIVLGIRAEGHESEVDALRGHDAEIGPPCAAGLVAYRALELVLGFDPASATIEVVRAVSIFSIGDQRAIADHNVLERSDRWQLAVTSLAFFEERHIQPGIHGPKPTVGLREVR